jgi:signal transduction histidine kinase
MTADTGVRLAGLVRRLTEAAENEADARSTLTTAITQLLDTTLEGDLRGEWDGDRLEQVVSNLVSNAIDHGLDEQPIALALRGGQEEVEVEVANQGQMPREVLDHAFEAFHKGPEQTGRKASGLGLGLYIAREIVRRHGGEIAICCERGATRIVTRLPRRAPEDAPAHGEKDRIAGQELP